MNTEGALTIMAYSQALSLNVLEIYSGDEYKSSLFLNSKSILVLYKQQPFSISRRMVLIFSKFILVTSKLF